MTRRWRRTSGASSDEIGRQHVPPTAQDREGPGAVDEVDRAARARSVRDVRLEFRGAPVGELPGGFDERDRVADDPRIDVDLVDLGLEGDQAVAVEDLARREVAAQRPGDDLGLLGGVRIVEQDLEHEPVELRLGQGIGPLGLDRVLGREHDERRGDRVGRVTDRDLVLLHDLEQRRLDLRRGAVDLVGQQEVREHGAELRLERRLARSVDARADEVGRHEVRRELDPLERATEDVREGLDRQGLGEAGDALEQDVSAGQQADEDAFEHRVLADDDAADLEEDRFGRRAGVVGIGEGAQVARGLRRGGLGHGGSSHVAVGWVGWLSISREDPLSQRFLKRR